MKDCDEFLRITSDERYIPLIFDDLKLKKVGSVYKALCPFHSEKTPSFVINNKQGVILYRCFGCGEAGNTVQYLKRTRNMTFKEALLKISEVTGVPLPESLLHEKQKPEIFNEFEKTHQKLLQNENALSHLEKRGIKDLSLFGSVNDEYTIFSRHHNKYYVIRYRPGKEPKYKYPRGFSKTFPFNLYRCSGSDIYLTEGIFDALNLYELYGLNACAILGSELRDKSIGLLKSFDNIVLVLDNDEAGKRATKKAIHKLYSAGFMNVFYLDYLGFPYKDINEAIQDGEKENVGIFLQINVREATHFLIDELKERRAKCRNDLETVHLVNTFTKQILKYNDIVQHKILRVYESEFDDEPFMLVNHYRSLIAVDEYKRELGEILEDENFDKQSLNQVDKLTKEKSSLITGINLKDVSLLKEDVQYNYVKSTLIEGVRYYEFTLNTVGARTSHGKTSFMINEAVNMALNGTDIGFFMLEDVAEAILSQMYINYLNKNITKNDDERVNRDTYFKNKSYYNEYLKDLDNIYVIDDAFYIEDIEKHLVYLKTQKSISMIFIDYLQLINVTDKYIRRNNRQEQVKYINSVLLECAKKFGLYLVVGAQMNRNVSTKDQIYSDSAYREAGDIEQDSSVIINLWNNLKNQDKQDKSLTYYIAKNRRGKSGMKGELIFNGEFTTLEPEIK